MAQKRISRTTITTRRAAHLYGIAPTSTDTRNSAVIDRGALVYSIGVLPLQFGQFVGECGGSVWVAWESADFDRLCQTFDSDRT